MNLKSLAGRGVKFVLESQQFNQDGQIQSLTASMELYVPGLANEKGKSYLFGSHTEL